MKLYNNFSVILKVGKEELSISYSCSVKQGDSLAPLLFCLVFQIAVEKVQSELTRNCISIPSFKSSSSDYATIRKPSKKTKFNMKTQVPALLFIDDDALPFSSRNDLINGAIICINIMAKFGLTIYTGRGSKVSKTEAVFFPSYEKINKWKSTLNGRLLMNDVSNEEKQSKK